MRRVFVVFLLVMVTGAIRAEAQPTPSPAAPAPAPARDAITQRPITVDEAVAIALEYQPNILARLGDYAAAKFRVDQAFAPLLP